MIPLFLVLSACALNPVAVPSPVEPLSPTEYGQLMAKHTKRTNQYSGFYQTFQMDATLRTTEVLTAELRQRAHFLQWDQRQFQQEREKALQDASAYAKVFLRFFTPDRDYDDLGRPKTIWKFYLDFGGNRFEGKAKKVTEKLIEVQTLYPHFDRFSTPYEITFNVPMTTIEKGDAKLIITSSLGTAEFVFPATP